MDLEQYFTAYHRVFLTGKVNGEMTSAFDKQVDEYFDRPEEERKPLVITITTIGGSAYSGQDLHERIRMLDAMTPITVMAIGHCSSAGATMLLAVPRERRFTTKHTEFLLHQPSYDATEIPKGL